MSAAKLFDHVLLMFSIKNDRHLAKKLGVSTACISKTRNNKLQIGCPTIIRVHELTGMSIADIKDMCGLPAYIAMHDRACFLLDD